MSKKSLSPGFLAFVIVLLDIAFAQALASAQEPHGCTDPVSVQPCAFAIAVTVFVSRCKSSLQERHSWSESVWKTVDIQSYGKFVKTISLQQRPAHLKFVHDQLPLGDRKFQRATIKDPKLKLRPCCKSHDEDPRHANSARSDAVAALLKDILAIHIQVDPPWQRASNSIFQHLINP